MTNTKFRTNTPPKKKAANIQVDKLRTFEGHPFKVLDDEDMNNLTESIKAQGIISPLIVRAIESTDEYEVISGHRRLHAAVKAGLSEVPALIYPLDRNEAVIAVVDSNLHRERLLPSEKAFAYKMKLEALKHQGKRWDLTSAPTVQKLTTRDKIAQDAGEKSGMTVARYIALTKLVPPLLVLVDEDKLAVSTAADYISDLTKQEQTDLVSVMDKLNVIPGRGQLTKIKQHSKDGTLTITVIETLLKAEHPAAVQVVLKQARLHQYFPQTYTAQQMEEVIVSLLEAWSVQHL